MRIDVHVYIEPDSKVLSRLDDIFNRMGLMETNIMATLADIQTTLTTVDTALATVKTDVETLLAKIAAIPPGGLTIEQQAAIDDIATHVQGIATSLGAIDTSVNPPPAP
jgi:archaellum component FlaC